MSDPTRTLKQVLNDANATTLASALQALGLGNVVRALPTYLFKQVPATSPTNMIASVHSITLPDDAKCAQVLYAYARVGTVTGNLTPVQACMTTATSTGTIGHSESGDITLASADAITLLDVVYLPRKMDVVQLTLPVVATTGVMAIPASFTTAPAGIVTILEATIVTGTNTGVCKVVTPSDSVPTTTLQVNLNLAKTQVQFRIADAVTVATVKLGLIPATNVDALLEASSPVL